jgi:hypothetical protein
MPRAFRITTRLEDVNGSFKRMIEQAPKETKALLSAAVQTTTFALGQRMKAMAPVSDEAPHMRDDITIKVRGLNGRAGILKGEGENDSAHVALYNEFVPNKQPFLRPAAFAERSDFARRAKEAIGLLDKRLGSGTGI